MAKRCFTAFLSAFFLWVIVEPTVALMIETNSEAMSVGHDDGFPCSDNHGGSPCDDSCPCLCCPGHVKVLTPSLNPALEITHVSKIRRFNTSENNHPGGTYLRVYRPPRNHLG